MSYIQVAFLGVRLILSQSNLSETTIQILVVTQPGSGADPLVVSKTNLLSLSTASSPAVHGVRWSCRLRLIDLKTITNPFVPSRTTRTCVHSLQISDCPCTAKRDQPFEVQAHRRPKLTTYPCRLRPMTEVFVLTKWKTLLNQNIPRCTPPGHNVQRTLNGPDFSTSCVCDTK